MSTQTQEVAPQESAPETAPVADATVSTENSNEAQTPAVTDDAASPASDAKGEESIFTEEELNQILTEALAATEKPNIPTGPTKFLGDDKKEDKQAEDLSAKIAEVTAQAEEAKLKAQESEERIQTIENGWSLVTNAVPDVQNILQDLLEGKEDAVPAHWKQENWERVTSNKVVYSLVEPLLKGEKIDIPKFISDIAAMRKNSAPQVSTKSEASAPVTKQRNFLAEAIK